MNIKQQLQRLWLYLRDGRPTYGFHGGRALPSHKQLTAQASSREALLVPNYFYDLVGGDGQAHQLMVQVGDYVRRHQVLTRPVSGREAVQHASTSGVITAIQSHPRLHPGGQESPHLVLTADGLDEALPPLPSLDIDADAETLRQRIEDCGVVGLGGAGFPTARKLKSAVHTLVINLAECEPYISCDDHLAREASAEILSGAAIAAKICGAQRIVLGIEDDKPEALQALKDELKRLPRPTVEIRLVPARYPSGNARQLFELLFNVRIPAQEHATAYGYLCHNVGTLKAVHDAVVRGLPLTERHCTLSGEGMRHPATLRIRFGTPLSALIQQCGGLLPQQRVILGGPMMGFEQANLRAAANKISNAILALPRLPETEASACIRCGECASACPMELLPQQLYWYSRADDSRRLRQHRLFDCIECGLCAAVCPSSIPLVQYYRASKDALRAEEQKQQAADVARERHEARQARLAREAAEREEKMRARQAALQNLSQERQAAAPAPSALAKPETPVQPSFNPTNSHSDAQKNAVIAAAQARAAARRAARLQEKQSEALPAEQINKTAPAEAINEALPADEINKTAAAANIEDKMAAAKAKAAARRAARQAQKESSP